MNLSLIILQTVNSIPDTLELKSSPYNYVMLIGLSFCYLCIALSRLVNSKVISEVFSLYFGKSNKEFRVNSQFRVVSGSSILLVINYFVSFSLCLYIGLIRLTSLTEFWILVISTAVPIVFLLVENLGLFFLSYIFKDGDKLKGCVPNTFLGYEVVGLLNTVLATIWAIEPKYNLFLLSVLIALILLRYIFKVIKNFNLVFFKNVKWYYIFLYLCTLEILPILVLYLYVERNFLN